MSIYFCCMEAVNNARKHAPGAQIEVRVAALRLSGDHRGTVVRFRVTDDDPGFDITAVASVGRGLRNVIARIEEVGGTLTIDSAPGASTVVGGFVPVEAAG